MSRFEAHHSRKQMENAKVELIKLSRFLPRDFLEEFGFTAELIHEGCFDNSELPRIRDIVVLAAEEGLLKV